MEASATVPHPRLGRCLSTLVWSLRRTARASLTKPLCGRHAIFVDGILDVDDDTISFHPASLLVRQLRQVPVIGGEHDGDTPQKDLVRVELGRRLSKNSAIHMRLQNFLVAHDEAWRRNLVQYNGTMLVPLETTARAENCYSICRVQGLEAWAKVHPVVFPREKRTTKVYRNWFQG